MQGGVISHAVFEVDLSLASQVDFCPYKIKNSNNVTQVCRFLFDHAILVNWLGNKYKEDKTPG